MSAMAPTKVFGLSLTIDPKILVGGLLAFAALVFWYESHDNSQSAPGVPSVLQHSLAPQSSNESKTRRLLPRRHSSANDQNKLELRVIDISRSDIDPTLHFDLLTRLHGLPEPGTTRNIFEFVQTAGPAPKEIEGPIIALGPPVVEPPPAPVVVAPPFSIALKYCGFVKSQDLGKDRKGFFLDGDSVLIGSEGEILNHRYRIVGLTAVSVQLEDVELKQQQTLSLIAKVNP